jgi:hypothetical protein
LRGVEENEQRGVAHGTVEQVAEGRLGVLAKGIVLAAHGTHVTHLAVARGEVVVPH